MDLTKFEKQVLGVGMGHKAADSSNFTTLTSSNPEAMRRRSSLALFLASFLALYFELVIIRYLSTEVRVFAYLKNLPLIASFFGLGLGMALGKRVKVLERFFPLVTLILFLTMAYAPQLHLTHIPFPSTDYYVRHTFQTGGVSPIFLLLRYIGTVLAIVALCTAFFVELGGIVGEQLAFFPSLRGYGLNLAGSLVGIAAYTLLSFSSLPPIVWGLLGFLIALPFFLRQRFAIFSFVLILLIMAVPQPNTYWSPYYRISLTQLPSPSNWPHPSAYFLTVNYDYHQKLVDLSPGFMVRNPDAEPNRSAFPTYELPYRLVSNPDEVLVVGAGTGNDVAAALRHGAGHIDAVEIDPVILRIGQKYHPERPYDSSRVTLHLDDARAFFHKATRKYDLIVFGYLDSHTLLTSFSSLRLDNFVYTLESFREARKLLRANGSVVLSFDAGRSFVTNRLFTTLTGAFGVPPRVYYTGYDSSGVVFIEGRAREIALVTDYPEITHELQSSANDSLTLATDRWPFLYLANRSIPLSILFVLIPFLIGAAILLQRVLGSARLTSRNHLHLFLLGAGFLLLETKGVTELSLLFGSTWLVNAVVICSFLTMGLLANALVTRHPISRPAAYGLLFVLLGVGLVFPYSVLSSFSLPARMAFAGFLVGLPVFCSGLVFSQSFRDVENPAQGLGVNLLGAVVGGTLENLVMIGGTPILGALAIMLYSLSAFCLRK